MSTRLNVAGEADLIVPATGKQVTMSDTHVERIRNGKIVSHSGDIDMLGLLQQIGAIPAPA